MSLHIQLFSIIYLQLFTYFNFGLCLDVYNGIELIHQQRTLPQRTLIVNRKTC